MRKTTSLSMAQARAFVRYREPFLTGQRWVLEHVGENLERCGLSTEISLVDELPRPIIELPDSSGYEVTLQKLDAEINELVSHMLRR